MLAALHGPLKSHVISPYIMKGEGEQLKRSREERSSLEKTYAPHHRGITVEPRFNEPLYNEILGITNDILQPCQSYSKMKGTESRFNEPRYNKPLHNEILGIMNAIRKSKRKIYPDIMNRGHHGTKDECGTDHQQ